MAAFLDACRFNPTAGGTTDWTYSSPVPGYQSPAAAGAVSGRSYKYRAESADLSQWELGEGTYNSGTGTFARTTVLFNSSGTTSKINFSTVPQVAIVALKEDLISVEEANGFTSAQQDQARGNILAAGVVRVQKFTVSGTYTPNANMLYCIIECVGGGGGGGGAGGSTGQVYGGGGGGSGGYSRLIASAATIGASKAVTIGAAGAAGTAGGTNPTNNGGNGGDTSLGSLCIGKGGSGGTAGSVANSSLGGAGGVAGTGDIVAAGNGGFFGTCIATITNVPLGSGAGGASFFGGAAPAVVTAGATVGIAAGNYGSGGSGGWVYNSASSVAGGAGSAGIVIITEFCSK